MGMIHWRWWYALIAAVAASLVLGVFGGTSAQQKVRIGLPVPNFAPLASVGAAEDLGYYKANGVEVEITAYRGGGAAQEALVARAADLINYFPPGVALAVSKGVKEKIVAAGQVQATGWYIMVLRDSPLRTLTDLGGKKVGITVKGTTTDFFALWAAQKGGVTIQTIPVGGLGLMPSLKSRQIDAAVLYPPLSHRLLVTGEGRALIDLGKEMGPVLPDVWVASQEMITGRPQQLHGTLKAMFRAVRYMQRNREYSLAYLKSYTKETDERALRMDQLFGIMARSPDGMIQRDWLESSLGLAKLGGITDLPRLEDIFTDRFIPVKVK